MKIATKMEEMNMEIKLTKRGQALVKRVGKVSKNKEDRKPVRKLYTLVHVETRNSRKHEWCEKVWVDEYKDSVLVAA